jgi:hypothetical protein
MAGNDAEQAKQTKDRVDTRSSNQLEMTIAHSFQKVCILSTQRQKKRVFDLGGVGQSSGGMG